MPHVVAFGEGFGGAVGDDGDDGVFEFEGLDCFDESCLGGFHEGGVECACDAEGDCAFCATCVGEVERVGECASFAGDDDLVGGVDGGDHGAGFAAYFVEDDDVEPNDCGHATGALFTCLLHEAASLLYEPCGFSDVQDASDGECGVFSEAVSCDERRAWHGVGVEVVFHCAHGCHADGHDGGLRVYGLAERVVRAFKHEFGEWTAEGSVDFVEDVAGCLGVVVEVSPHADALGALPGEHECSVRSSWRR